MQGGGEQPAGQQREEEVLCGGAHDETGAGACVVPMPDLGAVQSLPAAKLQVRG